MNNLQLLKELDSHNRNLSESKSKLEILEENKKINDLQTELDIIENKYNKCRNRLENFKENIAKLEKKLKEQEFLHREKKKTLYEGNIIDIKQLEQLSKEEKEIREIIDSIESDIIKNLQATDSIEAELNKIKREISTVKDIIKLETEQRKVDMASLRKTIFKETNYIPNLSSKIDASALNLYKKLRSQKSDPIVALKDNICGGCRMKIPSYQKNILEKDDEIMVCESCGRILYIDNL